MKLIHISEAFRMFTRARRVKKSGFKTYQGTPKEILKQIVEDCYNKKDNFFQTSTGHFCEFYTRDFALCIESLLNLGYKKEVHNTLNYAMSLFKKHSKITTTISPKGVPFDFPYFASDSLPFILYSLRIANATDLLNQHRDFIIQQTNRYIKKILDPKTDLVNPKKHFSSIKDHAKRTSSCYDNCMLFLLQQELTNLNLPNPLKKFNYKDLIMKTFWNGAYFYDDTRKKLYVSGDANTFPFWTGLISDKDIFQKAVTALHYEGLDKPFPLKYTSHPFHKFHIADLFAPNYEVNSIWVHLGLAYLQILKKFTHHDLTKHIHSYLEQVKKHKTFLEVYDKDGNLYKSFFYYTDEGMLWAANLLDLT